MKPTAKQKRMNLLAAFLVVLLGVLILMGLSAYREPIRTLRRGLKSAGYATSIERNVDAGDFDYLSDEADALKVGSERIYIFGFSSFDDAAAVENEFWQSYGEDFHAGTYLTDRYLLLYTGSDDELAAALEKITR